MSKFNIRTGEINYQEPGNGLPKWVKEKAMKRGYADALDPLSLFVIEEDINEAFACAAQGNGNECVMAQAAKRIGAESVYFYRTTAWFDFGSGPLVRFMVSQSIYTNIIEPFDRGDRPSIAPGIYPLVPASGSQTLKGKRDWERESRKDRKKNWGKGGKKPVISHTDRYVMATQ